MYKLVHNLALSMVLYHLLVGCCCHHAHGNNSFPHHDELAATCCSHHDHCDSSREKSNRSTNEPDREHGGCHDSQCVFVIPNPDSSARITSHVNPLVALGLAPQVTSRVYALCTPRESRQPSVAEPMRLHLLHQILLI